MAIRSPLRSRRLNPQKTEVTQRLITFQLRQETFALPLDRIHKVTTFDRVYGDPKHSGVGLTIYQGQELVVIDVGQQIFGDEPIDYANPANLTNGSNSNTQAVKYLLIVNTADRGQIGLPIDSPPILQSIPFSAFRELPKMYTDRGNINCVSLFSIETANRPPIFLLDPKLVANL
jgi:chemotaxis signal transduction protein